MAEGVLIRRSIDSRRLTEYLVDLVEVPRPGHADVLFLQLGASLSLGIRSLHGPHEKDGPDCNKCEAHLIGPQADYRSILALAGAA